MILIFRGVLPGVPAGEALNTSLLLFPELDLDAVGGVRYECPSPFGTRLLLGGVNEERCCRRRAICECCGVLYPIGVPLEDMAQLFAEARCHA